MLILIAALLGLILFVLAPQLVLWLLGAGLFVLAVGVAIGLALLAWFSATWSEVLYAGAAGAAVLCALWLMRARPAAWRACALAAHRAARWFALAACTIIAGMCAVGAVQVAISEGVHTAEGLFAAALFFGVLAVLIFRDKAAPAAGVQRTTDAMTV